MSTLDKVKQIVAKQLNRNPDDFTESTDLVEAGYESLDVIETIFAVEEEFGISIEYNANDPNAASLATVGDIARAVDEAVAAKQSGQ